MVPNMLSKKRLLPVITFISIFFTFAPTMAGAKTPVIGLALSGGGVKGFAHIGVLKAIEKAGIKIDLVCGTSMGSIIGALYASGYSPEQIENLVAEEDWAKIMNDHVFRRRLDHFEKKNDGQYSFRIQGKMTEAGLIKGQRITDLLCRWFSPVHECEDFFQLRIPFSCIATDLETGKPVKLSKGFLPEALRASISYPFAFTPVKLDGKLLGDGGIARNLPVSDLKEAGADIIIAVNVGSSLYTKEQINSIPRILEQCISFFGEQDLEKQKTLCDILIEPDVKGYSTFSFDSIQAIIAIGEQAGKRNMSQLKKIGKKHADIQNIKAFLPDLDRHSRILFKEIKISGLSQTRQNFVFDRIGGRKFRSLNLDEIQNLSQKILGTGLASLISYKISSIPEGKILTFVVKETEQFESNFGLRYDVDRGTAIKTSFLMKDRFLVGGRSSIESVISQRPRFLFREYVHEFKDIGLGAELELGYQKNQVSTNYDFTNQLKYISSVFSGSFSLNKKVSESGQIGFGAQKKIGFAKYRHTPAGINEHDYEYSSVFSFFSSDTLDDPFFPSSGSLMQVNLSKFMNLGHFSNERKIEESNKFSVNLLSYTPLSSKTTAGIIFFAGTITGNSLPGDELFYLGGKRVVDGTSTNFAGLRYQKLSGKNILQTGAELRFTLKNDHYILGRWNTGKLSESSNDLFSSKYISGGEFAYSLGTPLGAIEVSLGSNDFDHNLHLQASLGNSF